MTGDSVFLKIMDVDLLLQDITKMAPLKVFLGSIQDDNPALIALDAEVETFKKRIEQLILVASFGE
jgi:hypothetical protein